MSAPGRPDRFNLLIVSRSSPDSWAGGVKQLGSRSPSVFRSPKIAPNGFLWQLGGLCSLLS